MKDQRIISRTAQRIARCVLLLRKQRGLTQKQFGSRLAQKMQQSYVGRIERGTIAVNIETIDSILEAHGINLLDFLALAEPDAMIIRSAKTHHENNARNDLLYLISDMDDATLEFILEIIKLFKYYPGETAARPGVLKAAGHRPVLKNRIK
ncbi:MAG: hypothetical protein A2096_01365 [Spirochaetes bacterium GWF1_41_5]|nr:MAG: hypothetical protein A2096_01365 [Spirochaetes bacterium GWF1_41_5]HBE02004.1 hypothetical protein [Spirochaetia bacterium]